MRKHQFTLTAPSELTAFLIIPAEAQRVSRLCIFLRRTVLRCCDACYLKHSPNVSRNSWKLFIDS